MRRRPSTASAARPKPNSDAPAYIFQGWLATVLEINVNLAGDFFMHPVREANSARLRQLLQSCSNIDPLAHDLFAPGDHIAKMQSHAKGQASIR